MATDPARMQQQMKGLSVGDSSQQQHPTHQHQHPLHYYPAVPQPAPMGVPAQYQPQPGPAAYSGGAPMAAPAQYQPQPAPVAGYAPAPQHAIGSGWTAEAVQPEHARPGQTAGHYGNLQYAPSFNTAAGAAAAAGATANEAPSSGTGWLLSGRMMPPMPTAQLVGPHVRFNDYEPSTGAYNLSVLLLAHPSLSSSTVQVHWAVNGPAMTPAPSLALDEFMGFKFHRFDISLQLLDHPSVLNYLVGLVGGQAPLASHTIHLPARAQPWRWITYSCNGFHEEEPEAKYGGIGNLWRDVMSRHAQQPYHLQIGGGDQIYCDPVFELPSLKPWLALDDPHVRAKEPFTPQMLQEVEQYYFGHYSRHFMTPEFAAALASIPFHYSWDDHDVLDGWGSYPDYLQQSAVFQGIFAVARRFYLLFQQHCRYDNATSISRTIGDYSYHMVRNIGPNAILLSPDTRSERTTKQVVPPAAWDVLLREVERRLAARPLGSVQHLVVLLPVPIVYPKIPISESALAAISSAMANRKGVRDWMNKLNLPSGAVSQFNEPDLLDDLLDHWTSTDHVQERQMLVRRLQGIAASFSVRVTFVSGDVHVGAFGCFQAHPKQPIRVIDPKYMLQVISSAIGNEPPPQGVLTALETTSMATTAMVDTLDKMIKAFDKRKLKGARNYCEVAVLDATTDPATGAPQPPGGLSFTLRCEVGPPGRLTGIETFTQVAPVLLAGPRAAEAAPFVVEVKQSVSGVLSSVLPGETGQQLQQGLKTAGHKLANFLARV